MNELLLGLVIAGAVGDALTTQYVLRFGGRELNPLMRSAIEKIGLWPAMAAAKGSLVAALVYVKPDEWIWWAIVAYHVVLIVNNAVVILRLRKGVGS